MPVPSVSPRVLAYLQDIFPSSADAKTLSAALGVNPDTVRGVLPRLVAAGDAERTEPGRYKAAKPRKPAESAA